MTGNAGFREHMTFRMQQLHVPLCLRLAEATSLVDCVDVTDDLFHTVIERIRARVALCRSLATSTLDKNVARTLLHMAEEGEADIKRLEAEAMSRHS